MTMSRFTCALTLVATAFVGYGATFTSFAARGGQRPEATEAADSEEVLATGVDLSKAELLTVVRSSDGPHVAWKTKRDKKWVTVFDGRDGPAYDQVTSLTISPTGDRIVYVAKTGKSAAVVVDGKESGPYEEANALTFSRDGHRLAYRAKRNGKWVTVADGKESEEYEGPSAWSGTAGGQPVFSPDGRRYAFSGKQNDKWRVWIDGVAADGVFDAAETPVFSPDSTRVAVPVRRGRRAWAVFIDGALGPEFQGGVAALTFSPDSRRFAYRSAVQIGGKASMVVDGESQPQTADPAAIPVFSPNSRRFAYLTTQKNGVAVSVDGTIHPTFRYASTPVFSANSQHVAYRVSPERWADVPDAVAEGAPVPAGSYKIPKRWRVVVDGVAGPEYGAASLPAFTPDHHVAYVAGDHGAGMVLEVLDGRVVHSVPTSFPALADRDLKGEAQANSGGGILGAVLFAVGSALNDAISDARKPDTTVIEIPRIGPQGQAVFVMADGGGSFANRRTNIARRRFVANGVVGAPLFTDGLDNVQFSADGRVITYEIHEIRDVDSVATVDGKSVGKAWSTVVMGDVPRSRYDRVLHDSLMFLGPDRGTYLALAGGRLVRVFVSV
jgi:hypothetical protein